MMSSERRGKTEETGHTFWWLMEGGEVVDWQIEHHERCYDEEEWSGEMVKFAKCATELACEYDTLEIFEELWKNSPDGEHRVAFDSTYTWWVDYYGEADADFTYSVVPLHE